MIANVILLFVGVLYAENGYFIDERYNCNNVYDAVPNPQESTQFVTYLGMFDNTLDCINACIGKSTQELPCESYTWHDKQFPGYAKNCFGRFGYPLWTPVEQANVNCGRIIWNCQNDMDCSLNGKCGSNGNCTCTNGWSGYKCDTLELLPASKNAGYNVTDNGARTSSWGGAVLVDSSKNATDKNRYHMYLAEFDNHCGVNSWELNSVVTHAQSTNGLDGPFERVNVIHEHFAHEPDAIRGPNGEYVIYYVYFNWTDISECECHDGSTTPECNNKLPYPAEYITVMQYSDSPSGPFTEPEVVFPLRTEQTGLDTNLAGVINSDGSFTGLMRIWDDNTAGSEIHLATATNWKDGSTYKQHSKVLFPELISILTEDPFVYMDCNGYYHSIFHNMSPDNIQALCGGHAYSTDGINWVYGGYIYNNTVKFTDNTEITYSRRERPHFIFDSDGCTPIALTNGVQYGGRYGDATLTLLQPVKH